MTNVLVCGISGFVGRNIFERLSQRPELRVFGTYFQNRPPYADEKAWFGKLSCADLTLLDHARFVTRNMDIIIHAAAKTDGASTVNQNPAEYFPDNIRINTNLIQAACENKVGHFIFMSCSVMYPHTNRPLKEIEDDIYRVYPPYFMGARVKAFAEDLCRFFSELNKTRFTIIRHCTTYGPYDKFGPRGHACPAIIAQTLDAQNGTVHLYGAGREKRDLLYVSDLVRFIEMALDRPGNNYEVFNVGLGKSVSIRELAEKIIEISGRKLELKFDTSQPGMATDMMLDIGKAQEILDWQPKVSLEDGLKQAVAWYRNRTYALEPR